MAVATNVWYTLRNDITIWNCFKENKELVRSLLLCRLTTWTISERHQAVFPTHQQCSYFPVLHEQCTKQIWRGNLKNFMCSTPQLWRETQDNQSMKMLIWTVKWQFAIVIFIHKQTYRTEIRTLVLSAFQTTKMLNNIFFLNLTEHQPCWTHSLSYYNHSVTVATDYYWFRGNL